MTIPLPNLPTDNLYKFVAISGLLLIALGFYIPTRESGAAFENVLRTGQADMVFLACELLRDPYWPLHAERELGAQVPWPVQYERARQ